MSLAPVALFAYRRPELTRALLASLRANPEAEATEVVAFLDGPRGAGEAAAVAATREAILASGLPRLTLVARERNLGLAASVIAGVSALTARHGRVIVLEDDLVLAPTFLAYMNQALDRYADEPRVFSVAGTMFPLDLRADTDAVFLPFINSSGWGTWARAWAAFDPEARGFEALARDPALRRRFDQDGHYPFFDMLAAYRAGRVDSWAIRWYLSVFQHAGLSLFPAVSQVENHGWGPGGTHAVHDAPSHARSVARPLRLVRLPPAVEVDEAVLRRVRRFMGRDHTLLGKVRYAATLALRRLRAAPGGG